MAVEFPTDPQDGDFFYLTPEKKLQYSGGRWKLHTNNLPVSELAPVPIAPSTGVTMATGEIDLALSDFFKKTVTAATTITVVNPLASGKISHFILELTNGGAAAVTWPASFHWTNGEPPSLTAAGVDTIGGYSHDGGSTWRVSLMTQNSKAAGT